MALERISAARWKQLPSQLQARTQQHATTVLAAGVAFYGFLALLPVMVIIVSIYGLFADPAEIEQQVAESAGALPDEARRFLVAQLESVTSTSGSGLTLAVTASTLVALWSASAGISNLMKGVAVASGTNDYRNFAVKRGLAVALTLGASAFVAVSMGVIAVLPAWLADTGMGSEGRILTSALRFPLIGALLVASLGVLYHYSQPDPEGRPKLLTWGTLIATVVWIVASLGFSWYTANFGSYNQMYGSLGVIIVVLLWLWLSAVSILLGAEVDGEIGGGGDDDHAAR